MCVFVCVPVLRVYRLKSRTAGQRQKRPCPSCLFDGVRRRSVAVVVRQVYRHVASCGVHRQTCGHQLAWSERRPCRTGEIFTERLTSIRLYGLVAAAATTALQTAVVAIVPLLYKALVEVLSFLWR